MKQIIVLLFVAVLSLNRSHAQTHDSLHLSNDLHKQGHCGMSGDYLKKINQADYRADLHATFQTATNNFAPGPAVMTCGRFQLFFQDVNLGVGYGFDDPVVGANLRQCACDVATYIQTVYEIPAGDGTPIEIFFDQSWGGSYSVGLPSPVTLAIGGPVLSNTAFLSGTSGFYGGNTYDHYTTGIDPDAGNIDGVIQVNFGLPFRDCSQPRNCATYDLYSVLLHEFTHAMGWFSSVKEAPIESIYTPFLQYSKYDEFFLFYGDVRTGPLTKIVDNSTYLINSVPAYALSAGSNLWVRDNLQNDPVNNQNFPGFSNLAYTLGGTPPGTSSHLADYQTAFQDFSSNAPGFIQNYVMSHSFQYNQVRNVWTEQEMRALNTMGYQFAPGFLTTNGYVVTNRHPYTTKVFWDYSWTNTGPYYLSEAELNTYTPPDDTITNCDSTVFDLSADPTLFDADGDPIRIFPGSLYNIRGTGSGGNNHNCLTVTSTPSGDVIKYVPRPDFLGRAQFGFHLYDGKEKGDFMIYTIDVSGCNTCGSNLVVAKDFEEGMEIKTQLNPLPDNAASHFFRNIKHVGGSNTILADGVTFPNSNGVVTEKATDCTPNEGYYASYSFNPSNPGAPNFAAIPGTQRYFMPMEVNSYFRLCSSPQTCTRYILEFDIFSNVNISTITMGFTNNPVPSASPVSLINTVTQSVPADTVWQHITIPINYCSATSCDHLVFQFSGTGNYFQYFIDNLELYVDPGPPVFSVSAAPTSTTICQGSSTILSATPVNPMCSVTYNWTPGNLTTASVNVSPALTTTYVVTASDGCVTDIATAVVTVTPAPSITATASQGWVCVASPNSTLTATGGVSYVWNPGSIPVNPTSVSPTITTTYTVTGTDANGCSATAATTVVYTSCSQVPCMQCTPLSGTFNTATFAGNSFCITGTLTITGNVTVNTAEFQFSPSVSIIIAPTGNLTIINSHFYACTSMWQGITVQNGGRLSIQNSLVEDAITAVSITNNTQTSPVITVTNTTFNKNNIGIRINNYTQAITTYPFSVNNCVFTCRNIPFTPNSLTFPSAATIGATATNAGSPLSNPVINNGTYSQSTNATLKNPFIGAKSMTAIQLINVGLTLNANTTSPAYFGFAIGAASNRNTFDNHYICIDLFNSNFTSIGATYQNTFTYGQNGTQGGIGIYAVSDQNNNNRLRVIPSSSGVDRNRFVDCSRAIYSSNYFEHEITEGDFRSTQIVTAPTVLTNNRGKYGVHINTNRYRVCNINYNTLSNIENGITMIASSGAFTIAGVPGSATQYAGSVNMNYNTITPQVSGFGITTQFISNAITLSNTSSGAPYFANGATPQVYVDYNQVEDAYRGINSTAWNQHNVYIRFNIISLVNDPYNMAGNPTQYGISSTNYSPSSPSGNQIMANTITGFGYANADVQGIIVTRNAYPYVVCNITDYTTDGIVFDDINTGTVFAGNEMITNLRGFVLRNNAVIGQQGTTTNPQDNQWTGTWNLSGQYKTATLSGSSAQNSKLYIRTTAVSPFNPDGSAFTSGTPLVDDYTITGATLIPTTSNPAITNCQMMGIVNGMEDQTSNTPFDVTVFPNPGTGNFSISIPGLNKGDIEVGIWDIAGKLIYQKDQHVTNGLTQFTIDVTSGIYFCKITDRSSGEIFIAKLIVQK
jgi:hypothetical protein